MVNFPYTLCEEVESHNPIQLPKLIPHMEITNFSFQERIKTQTKQIHNVI